MTARAANDPPAYPADPILARLEASGVRLGLAAIRRVLGSLGDPHLAVPAILVAGTNGKGSTVAFLSSILGAAGYRAGVYTSPHLERVEERIRLGGETIAPERLAALLERVLAAAAGAAASPPTYFEALTAAAFLDFAERGAEVAVLEVGLGGRLDATNASEPFLSLVTSISLEHQRELGPTLGAIAREKAGILRGGRTALAWLEEGEAWEALRAVAEERGTLLQRAAAQVTAGPVRELGWEAQHVTLTTRLGSYGARLALLGAHQIGNAGLALRAAEELGASGWPRIDAGAIERGIAAARWPGRLEPVPIPGGGTVLLDAAHNPDGVVALAGWLERRVPRLDLLFGVLDDKDAARMLPPLARLARRIVLTGPPSSRAVPPARLAELLPAGAAIVEADPRSALDAALSARPELLVACGSIVLVGEVRRELRERFGVPAPAGH